MISVFNVFLLIDSGTYMTCLSYFLPLFINLLRTYGLQGGAGTWSDGKLVTRIGKNSSIVVAVSVLRSCYSFMFTSN